MKILIAFLLLFALGLASAAPRLYYNFPLESTDLGGIDLGIQGKEKHLENEAKSQVISAAVVGAALPFILPPLISGTKRLAKYIVCDELTQLQEYTDNEEKDAKIMALVKIMDDLFDVKETNKIKKQLSTKNNRVAEAELFDWVKDYLCD